MSKNAPLKIFPCTKSVDLTRRICDSLGVEVGKTSCAVFSDGEIEPCYEETIRGSHVFIIQSTPPPADNLLELLLMIDAAKRASAYKIIAVLPTLVMAVRTERINPAYQLGPS
jgi:ribose-phosphate pyrophosphokinase